jgi:hypothetical protein
VTKELVNWAKWTQTSWKNQDNISTVIFRTLIRLLESNNKQAFFLIVTGFTDLT